MPDRDDSAPRLDVRALRFSAGITAALLLACVFLGITGLATARVPAGWFACQPLSGECLSPGPVWALPAATPLQRALDPAFLLLLAVALLFLWGLVSPRTSPGVALFRAAIAPRLGPPHTVADPVATRFAQGLGLALTVAGLLLQLAGVPWAIPLTAALAFVAAFLNAAFGLCVGSWIHLTLQRTGLVGRHRMPLP